jgi:HPt (histidine-containing phosphotransfer) domain-containing protein
MVRFWSLIVCLIVGSPITARADTGIKDPFSLKIAQEIPHLLDDPLTLRRSIEERLAKSTLSIADRQALLLTQVYLALLTEDHDLAEATILKIKPLVREGTLPFGWYMALEARSQSTLTRDADVFNRLKRAEEIARTFQDRYLLVQVLVQQSSEAINSFRLLVATQKLQEAEAQLSHLSHQEWILLYRQEVSNYQSQTIDDSSRYMQNLNEILQKIQSLNGFRYFKHVISFNLALIQMKQNNHQRSLEYLNDALIWAISLDDRVGVALTYQAKAMVYQGLSQVDDALREAHEAQKNFETFNSPHRRYWNSLVLAELYMIKNDTETAERFAQDAHHWLEQSKYHRDEYPYMEFMANLASQKLQHKKSAELWRELYFKRYESIADNDRRLIQKLNAEFEVHKLESKNALQEKELDESTRQKIFLMIGVLSSLVIIVILMRSRVQDKIIKKQKEHIQGVIDSIQEGILRCNAQGLIEGSHSKQLESILEEGFDLAQRSLFDCLIAPSSLQSDEKEQIRQTLAAVLHEEELAWELNVAQLPTRLPYKGKLLSVYWQPLWDDDKRVKGLQLVIRDDSQEEKLRNEVLREKSRQDFLQVLWQELLSQNFGRATNCVQETRDWLNYCRSSQLRADGASKRHWHTLKGNARSLGLKQLATEIHLIESGALASSLYSDTLTQSLDRLLRQYETLFAPILQTNQQTQDSVLAICDRIFKDIRQRYPELADRTWHFEYIDGWRHWTPELLHFLENVLPHALNNAVDHGYIRPEASGRERQDLVFKLETLQSDGSLSVRLWDQGAGIQWKKLEEIAKNRGWPYRNREELAAILWEDSVTTADHVSISSGRGVGLSALRDLVERQHGSIHLAEREDGKSGTCLSVSVPLHVKRKSA